MIERMKERFHLIRPLLIPFGMYLVTLGVSLTWIETHPDADWRYLVALLPLVPGIFLTLGILRAIRKLDEMSRMILVNGIEISFAFTLFLTISLGFLGMAGFPQPNAAYISFFMLVMWLVGKLFITRKYQ